MFVRTRWFALRTGYEIVTYDIATDLPYGFSLYLGKASPYRWLVDCHFDWPRVIWADRYWRADEPGVLRGVPVRREQTRLMAMAGLRYWPRAMVWPRYFKVKKC